jgi:hypothetical protein
MTAVLVAWFDVLYQGTNPEMKYDVAFIFGVIARIILIKSMRLPLALDCYPTRTADWQAILLVGQSPRLLPAVLGSGDCHPGLWQCASALRT